MKSVMTHSFSNVPKVKLPRSSFDRSFGHKTTFDAGLLIPIMCDEALPGDTMSLRLNAFARMNTPIFPIMDNLHMDTFFFEVPMRLLWSNWKKFNGEQVNPADSIDFTIPQMVSPAGGYLAHSLSDYLGLPTLVVGLSHSALFHRAYTLIWDEWFRDENLQNSETIATGDGPDTDTDYPLQRRGKRHDYFTSGLPWPQKQTIGVSLPLGTSAPVLGIAKQTGVHATGPFTSGKESDGGAPNYAEYQQISNASADTAYMVEESTVYDGAPNIWADLSAASSATINQLRQSFQIQALLERDARGGTRYTEIILSHWSVSSPDQRQQRPIYLGGGSTPVNVNPIAQTSSTDATSPQGNLAAMATVGLSGHGFTRSFTEHSIIIGLVSVRADLTYQQGLPRMFSRSTRYDFYWPSLSVIGEQTILNKEIYAQGTADTAADAATFAYQERYAEYRYKQSQITGKFRSNDATSLDPWHLSQDFSALPTLGSTFIEENPPMDRVMAVTTEPDFIFDSFFDYKCARVMPMYGVPASFGRM